MVIPPTTDLALVVWTVPDTEPRVRPEAAEVRLLWLSRVGKGKDCRYPPFDTMSNMTHGLKHLYLGMLE